MLLVLLRIIKYFVCCIFPFFRWDLFDYRLEPIYVVKHATSSDGINWQCDEHICIDAEYYREAIGRLWVIKDEVIYIMLHNRNAFGKSGFGYEKLEIN